MSHDNWVDEKRSRYGWFIAYHLEHDQEVVGCYHCMKDRQHTTYGYGEAFLVGPEHSPCDGNANYVCRGHLDSDFIIDDGTNFDLTPETENWWTQ